MKAAIEAPLRALREASLVAFERRQETFPWNWHYHPEIELTLILEGRGTRLVGDHSDSYGPDDFILLGSNLPHTWSSGPASRRNRAIVVQFRRDMLPEAVLALPEFASVSRLLADAALGLRFPPATAKLVRAELRNLVSQKGLGGWLALVGILYRLSCAPRSSLASPGHRHQRSSRLSSRLEQVTSHLERRFRDNISVVQMARLAGLSERAFSRFFQKMTHRTFVEYRNALRIREACRLLEESDLSVTQIAYECGFSNLSNFHRRFQEEKGMPPRRYRRIHEPPTPRSGTKRNAVPSGKRLRLRGSA